MEIYNQCPIVVKDNIDKYLKYHHKKELLSDQFKFILGYIKFLVDHDIPIELDEDGNSTVQWLLNIPFFMTVSFAKHLKKKEDNKRELKLK